MPIYRVCGLTVSSELDLPGLTPAPDPDAAVDLAIRLRPAPAALEAPVAATRFWQADRDRFLFDMPGLCRFMAEGGRSLDLETEPGGDPADALPFLLGTGLGAVLHQRGVLVLHASTVEFEGRAYAFCGQSGIGKSTLAAALCAEGCRLVTDDVCAVRLDEAGRPVVEPDGRLLKLFSAPARRLGLEAQRRGPVRRDADKSYVAPPAGHAGRPAPLAGLYQLRRFPPTAQDNLAALSPLAAAHGLLDDVYRSRIAKVYAADGRAMATTAAMLKHAPAFLLARPEAFEALPGVIAKLRAQWSADGG